MLGAGGNEVSDPPAVCEFSSRSLRHTPAGHKSHRLLRVPPIRLLPLPEMTGDPKANREYTQVENLCYERQRGAARAREQALLAERSQDGEARAASSE